MKKFLIPLVILVAVGATAFAATWFWNRPSTSVVLPVATPSTSEEELTIATDELPAAPTIRTTSTPPSGSEYPTYFFLFTHTEDHINHTLSEERYTRIGPMLETLQEAYPSEDITWTIEFQGADAQTVAERDSMTGTATYLRSLAAQGLVEFGYHAHHDPTYLNRPQKKLNSTSTWQQVYDALFSWVSCEKDPLKGGCVAPTGGGLMVVQEYFGPVQIVTGVGAGEGAQIERSAGAEAIRSLAPDRLVGFGFPDHGATRKDAGYIEARDALMRLLSPADDTTSTTFWMDNTIRINDGVPLEGLQSITLRDGAAAVQADLQQLDSSHVNIINTGVADKFLYAASQSSPTVWAYAHPTNPELSGDQLLTAVQKEKGYVNTQAALEYLLGTYLSDDRSESGFVSADQVADLVTSDDFWEVDAEELQSIAAWIVQNWNGEPPVYTYDGRNYYSLTDSFALLVNAIGGRSSEGVVSRWYGPWALPETKASSVAIEAQDLIVFAQMFGDGPEVEAAYSVGEETLSAGQLLYAMAYQYLLQSEKEFDGQWNTILIPATTSLSDSYSLLEDLGCIGCADTSWSLKPARFDFE